MQSRSQHASGVLVRVGSQVPQVPRPGAVDLHLQREAEDDPNGDDHPEHPNAPLRRVDDDRANNVPDDEHFQAEQDGLAELSAQPPVTLPRVTRLQQRPRVPTESEKTPDDHDPRADGLNPLGDINDELIVSHRHDRPFRDEPGPAQRGRASIAHTGRCDAGICL